MSSGSAPPGAPAPRKAPPITTSRAVPPWHRASSRRSSEPRGPRGARVAVVRRARPAPAGAGALHRRRRNRKHQQTTLDSPVVKHVPAARAQADTAPKVEIPGEHIADPSGKLAPQGVAQLSVEIG